MPLNKTFAVERWVDLENGNDAANGLTRTTPWRTLKKVADELFVPAGLSTPVSVLVRVAGGSGGSNGTSRGWDQFTFDALTPARTAVTEVGFVAWTEADGARPGGAAIVRPVLRADTPFSTLTQVGVTAVYKSNVLSGFPTTGAGAVSGMSQVLYRAGVTATLDSDGAWRCHFKIVGANTDADAAIATALAAAGPYTAWYKTDTREIFVNLDTNADGTADLLTAASNWSWCPQQLVENFSKIRCIGFTYVGVEGFDFLWGERGVAIFDARTARVQDCRVYEMGVHGISISYFAFPLQDIRVDRCEVYGLGQSPTGQSMIGISGGTTADLSNVKVTDCKARRYMLQNPGGTNYNRVFSGSWITNPYGFVYLDIGTSNGASSGFARDAEIVGCTFRDVSAAKVAPTDAGVITGARHAVPADRTQFEAYPVRFKDCDIRTFGAWFERSVGANEGSRSIAFSNCRIMQESPPTTFPWGVRTMTIFNTPAQAGATFNYGLFDNTQWTLDLGTGDGANTYAGIGVQNASSAGQGLRVFITARNSTLTTVSRGTASYPLFDYSNDNAGNRGEHKIMVTDIRNCKLAYTGPLGMTLAGGMLAQRDVIAGGTTNFSVFSNNTYVGFNQAAFSTANATWAAFKTNIDPLGRIDPSQEFVAPDYAPSPITVTSERVRAF